MDSLQPVLQPLLRMWRGLSRPQQIGLGAIGAAALALLFIVSTFGHSSDTAVAFSGLNTDDEAAIAAMQRFVPRSVGDCIALIERHMLAGPWVMGAEYTTCDPYLFTLAQWLEQDGVDPAQVPGVIAHRRRVAERAATRRAIAEEERPTEAVREFLASG